LNTEKNIETMAEELKSPNREDGKNHWGWMRFGFFVFGALLLYIFNSNHTTKALKEKNKLSNELKELNAEKVFLESQVTNASKQTEVAKKLEGTGVAPLKNPPIKIEKEEAKK
jgi:hypothetical protein